MKELVEQNCPPTGSYLPHLLVERMQDFCWVSACLGIKARCLELVLMKRKRG